MTYIGSMTPSAINLQSTLAASSSGLSPEASPHHPLTCQSTLALAADGTLTCEHAQVPPGDHRTQACLDQSVAILLLEVLRQREDADAG